MNEEEIKNYYNIFTAYWKIFKQYSTLDGSDEYWSNLLVDTSKAHDTLQDIDHDLSFAISTAMMQALQRKYREATNGNS